MSTSPTPNGSNNHRERRPAGLGRPLPSQALVVLIALCTGAAPLLSAQAQALRYVTDRLVLTVRDEPYDDANRLTQIESGDIVVVLEERPDGFSRVRLEDSTEGWIRTQYLEEESPETPDVQLLRDELESSKEFANLEQARLQEVIRGLELDNGALLKSAELLRKEGNEQREKLATLQAQLEEARKPNTELEELTAQAENMRKDIRLLRIQNRELKELDEQIWLAAGGGLVAIGLFFGLVFGRRGSRQRGGWSG